MHWLKSNIYSSYVHYYTFHLVFFAKYQYEHWSCWKIKHICRWLCLLNCIASMLHASWILVRAAASVNMWLLLLPTRNACASGPPILIRVESTVNALVEVDILIRHTCIAALHLVVHEFNSCSFCDAIHITAARKSDRYDDYWSRPKLSLSADWLSCLTA